MTREEVRGLIEKTGILPASIVFRGKIPVVELTMTVPGEVGVIRELARMHPGLVVGAGTVLDLETADYCLGAGAAFMRSWGWIVKSSRLPVDRM
jgi:2-keto-3-deoxy-6-phosphogluconate aldolase